MKRAGPSGKKLYDKREVQKKRSWERERSRLLRQKIHSGERWLAFVALEHKQFNVISSAALASL
jgi:hypothetical protein